VSLADAADYAGVCTKTIRRWVQRGVIPAYRIGPRLVRINLDDLDAALTRIPTARVGGDAA